MRPLKIVRGTLMDSRTGVTLGAPANHSHVIDDLSGLAGVLDGKADVDHTHPGAGPHTHPQSEIVNLATDLAGKASADHAHAGMVLDNDVRLSDARTPLTHAHTIADTTGLQTALDGKSDTSHTHPGGSGPVKLRKTADQAVTDAVIWTDVTGLTTAVAASTAYHFDFCIYYTSAATTTALHLSLNGPAGATLRYNVDTQTTATAHHHATQTAYNTVTNPATGGGAVPLMARVTGTIVVAGTAGTLALRMKSEVALSAVTVLTNSWGVLY